MVYGLSFIVEGGRWNVNVIVNVNVEGGTRRVATLPSSLFPLPSFMGDLVINK